jgi:preprotein translocase subunit SecA
VALTAQDMARVRLPDAFLSRLMALVGEGTTLVVTDAAVLPSTTGKALTVVTNDSNL